jgi:multisubunit Na+/H+ antiporter MnhB subunit
LIDDKTLLQADATVIAGVLILLTILLTVKPYEKPKGRKQEVLRALVAIGLTGLIALFSSSAIAAFYESQIQVASNWAIFGFFWFIGVIAAIVWVSLYGVKEKTQPSGTDV